jgi:hypothetical protein
MTFQHTDRFIPGDTIRAEPVNAAFDAIAGNLLKLDTEAEQSFLRFPAGKTSGNTMAVATSNSFVYIDPNGQLTSYPKSTFDSEIGVATAAASSASASASQAALSEYNARQSELAAAASAEIAQQSAASVAGAAFFAGDWNAASGNLPAAPADGSSIWRASTDGTGATAAYKTGDYIIWDLVSLQFRPMPGMPRVETLSGILTSEIARVEAKANSALALASAGL